jgi:hypothetical protein
MMKRKKMIRNIFIELKHHAPFTFFGAITGIVVMLFFQKMPYNLSYQFFYVLHPIHVVLSALVTTSMYENYKKCNIHQGKCNIYILLIIGYMGSIGIATISDSLLPYLGETLLNLPNRGIHIGFIEKWWLINPMAVIGILIAYLKPSTKVPHAGHVLLSTWASLFHIIMALGGALNWYLYLAIFIFMFISVWIPCCVSDIVFPLLFVGESNNK